MRSRPNPELTPCSRRGARSWLLAAILASIIGAGCTSKPNVLLISVDSLRADHLGAYGYERDTSPTIDRLAREGALFTNAVSSTSWTLPAHMALLTGLPDTVHGVTNHTTRLDPKVETLAQAFQEAGYYTVGFFSGPFLHPAFGFGRGFKEYVDCTGYHVTESAFGSSALHQASHADVTNPTVLKRVIERLERVGERRFFFFVHLWDVHYDYIPPPPYDRMFDPGYRGNFSARDFSRNWAFRPGMNEADYEHVVALYDGEIRSTDDTISAILEAVARYGLLEETLVVITADHGDEFLEHGGKGHRHTLYEELVHVPLVFRYPKKIAARRVESVVSLIDVAPTILDFAGLEPLERAVGVSLRSLMENSASFDDRRPALAELNSAIPAKGLLALRLGEEKVIIRLANGSASYYDLASDPGEKRPRDGSGWPAAKPLIELARKLQDEYRQRAIAPQELPPSRLQKKTREQLRSLGYIQ